MTRGSRSGCAESLLLLDQIEFRTALKPFETELNRMVDVGWDAESSTLDSIFDSDSIWIRFGLFWSCYYLACFHQIDSLFALVSV
jgi:hypothetical protein